jgi:regulatory protein
MAIRPTRPDRGSGSSCPEGLQGVRAAAVALLARRDWASPELRAKLESLGHSTGAVESTLSALMQERLLDDGRYAQGQVISRSERGQGPLRIGEHLRGVGLPDALIEAALAGGPDWSELAREVRQRRFGPERPRTRTELARQARFLQYRGFSSDEIGSATGAELDLDSPP